MTLEEIKEWQEVDIPPDAMIYSVSVEEYWKVRNGIIFLLAYIEKLEANQKT